MTRTASVNFVDARRVVEAAAGRVEEEVRRTMQGEDLLLRDSILLARQVEHQERRAERAQQQAEQARLQERQRAEQERRLLLAQAIRRLHGLGQDAEAIAAALAVDTDEVRRVLSG